MRTKEEYIKGLGKMRRNIYFNGELIDRTDERQMNCLNTIGTTFNEAARPGRARGLEGVVVWWCACICPERGSIVNRRGLERHELVPNLRRS